MAGVAWWSWRVIGAALALGLVVGAALLAASAVWKIDQDQQGVVLRFGRYVRTVGPGIQFTLPWPAETLIPVSTTQVRTMPVGYKLIDRAKDIPPDPDEVQWLTGDTNIVELEANVLYTVENPVEWLFGLGDPTDGRPREFVIRKVTESVFTRLVAEMTVDDVLSTGKTRLQLDSQRLVAEVLDELRAGVAVVGVNITRVNPPPVVIGAFNDVASALADRERRVNEAHGYAMKVKPTARGRANEIAKDAEVYRTHVVSEAQGAAAAFAGLAEEVAKHPELSRRRLWLDAMEEILASGRKLVVQPARPGETMRVYVEADR